ncbi:hypothetical protein [Taklimakanibacter lacteus]|uniref:hypothetical protein n=1 Tax=Taklimakanibacter lacteus TaxID=2268456 RepID=UPI000E65FFE3
MAQAPSETVHDLLDECTVAWREGADFPTIWQEILTRHPLVAGPPVQGYVDSKPVLKVSLVGGHRLVFGPQGFSLN